MELIITLIENNNCKYVLKDNKIFAGFRQTQQHILFYFYLGNMFRPIDHR